MRVVILSDDQQYAEAEKLKLEKAKDELSKRLKSDAMHKMMTPPNMKDITDGVR